MHNLDTQELDLRVEMDDLITGRDFGKEKFIPFIHRKIRTDKHNNKTKCSCWNHSSNEGSNDCESCLGMGFLWDEYIIPGFIYSLSNNMIQMANNPSLIGRIDDEALSFVTTYTTNINKSDWIIEPILTEDGAFIAPYKANTQYVVNFTRDYRLDFGKSQFTEVIIKSI